ncbi:D-2-hydroxyacid dehydrogenase [Amnibacterium endophyticum]|uniref:D-2-hydroxyacid dehydrogenase n=1 Tax=Amnibacterium endophyticum TaxID=2109337 RepID=A0ABW4LC85_9MICO
MSDRRLRAVVATPLPDALVQRIRDAEPRLDLVVEQDLLPPMRLPGDHGGDPAFRRSEADERRYRELVDSAEVLYGMPDERSDQLARTIRANPRLAWVQLMAAGGGAQVRKAELTGEELARIRFTTTAGVHAVPLAEWCEFGLLAGFKSLPRLQQQQRDRSWPETRWLMRRLEGSRVLIVGLGAIGRELAKRLAERGVHVAGTSRHAGHVDHVHEVIHPRDLAAEVGGYHGVVVTLPGTDETRHLVSAEVIAAMRDDAVVVNVGRGTVIDQDALIERLAAGRLGFAALDVTDPEPLPADSPLWGLPNVLISPHTAALSDAEDELIAELFARNATRWLDGEPLINVVNTHEFY